MTDDNKNGVIYMKKILIVDDSYLFRQSYIKTIEGMGFECFQAENGLIALDFLLEKHSEVCTIIVDQEMPIMNGFELVENFKKNKNLIDIPVIFVSLVNDIKFIKSVFALGIYDYLIKPVENDIFFLKVKNAIKAHQHDLTLKTINNDILKKNETLESLVMARTNDLNEMLSALLNALESANYYNDNDTGNHIHRVAEYSELIAKKLGLEASFINQIKLFAPIHDIGKVGVNQQIIKKKGKLNTREFNEIKTHVTIGYKMLKNAPISDIAKNIIKYHHEKWNGSGYIDGLKGEAIPIEARIVGIADVFDALISKRVYKEPYSIEKIIEILKEERGESFQEELVDIILENIDEMQGITNKLR